MPVNEKNDLIADIKRMLSPVPRRTSNYDSYTANRVVDKLLIRIGIIVIVALLGYMLIRDSTRGRGCRLP